MVFEVGLNSANKVPLAALAFVDIDGNAVPVSATNPLPATSGGGGGGSSLADSLVIDAAGVYWILRDNGTTLTYVNLATGVVGTPVAPVTPASKNSGLQIVSQTYTATASGTGYSTGDLIEHILTLDITVSPPTVATSAWINITTGAVIAAPSSGNINPVDDNVNATIVGTLPAYAATPTFNLGSLNGAALDSSITLMSAKLPTTLGQKTSAASMSVVLSSDQTAVAVSGTVTANAGSGTFAISAATLPLPTGAATAAGLSAINTTLGTPMQQTGGSVAATQSGAWTTGRTWTLSSASDSVTIGGALPTGTNAIGSVTIGGTLPNFAATPTFNLGTLNGAALDASVTALGAQLPATIGRKTSALSLSASLSSDQLAVPTNSNAPQMLSRPAANSINANGAAIQWNVEGGCSYYLALTNPAAATSQFVGTVAFQSSIDGGASWQAINALPQGSPTGQVVTQSTTVGLWLIDAPSNTTVALRATFTAYTSGTVVADMVPYGQPGAVFLLPWTYTVTSGQTLVGPIDTTGIEEIGIQISAVTTTVLTVQGTNDPSLTNWDTVGVVVAGGLTSPALTIAAIGTYRASTGGYRWLRIQCTTTGTVLTVQGVAARLGTPTSGAVTLSAGTLTTVGTVTTVTTVAAVTNLTQIGGNVPAYAVSNGSTNKVASVSEATAVSQVDQSATAFAGAGSVVGTIVASAQGGGAVIAAEINVTALTLGTATAVFAILQESRGGTNFTDIWVSDPITATGIISMPAIPVAGRRRWRFFSAGGTSTTVTVTITALELPAGYPVQRQFRDYFAATNPFATVFNNVALTASNFVLSTISTATTPFHIEGLKQFSAFMILGGAPTVTTQPIVTVQVSPDGTNWVSVTGSTLTAAGNGLYMVQVTGVTAKFARLIVSTAAIYSAGSYTISNIGLNGVN